MSNPILSLARSRASFHLSHTRGHGLASVLGLLLLSACGQAAQNSGSTEAATGSSLTSAALAIQGGDDPVVLELFQSQGCSACPPANANINTLQDRPDVLALSFAVTFWDRLGWKDTFGSPRWTERQWEYARSSGRSNVATPQVIINGTVPVNGGNREWLQAAIVKAGSPQGGPDITVEGGQLQLSGEAPGNSATVWLVRYDPTSRDVPIRAGENNGRTLPHRGIVTDLIDIGSWFGEPLSIALPASGGAVASAILIQRGKGGPIIASHKI